MDINEITKSRIYSWKLNADTSAMDKKMNLGGRAHDNPLLGRVTSYKVIAGQAGDKDMYLKKARELKPDYQPSDREPIYEQTSNPCVYRNIKNGKLVAMIFSPRTTKLELYVDGRPMTEEEKAIYNQYKKTKTTNPYSVSMVMPYIDGLTNVEGTLDELPNVED